MKGEPKYRYKRKSRILQEVHEGAREMYALGQISHERMLLFDALCLDLVPDYTPQRIKALRSRLDLTQEHLASVINTSLSAVRQWENGTKHPSGASRQLLYLLEQKGLEGVIATGR